MLAVLLALSARCVLGDDTQQVDPWTEFVLAGRWQEGQDWYAQALVSACASGDLPTLAQVRPLYYGYSLCRNLRHVGDRLSPSGEQRLTAWLLDNPDFTEPFLLAFGPNDNAGRAFETLYELLSNFGEGTVLRYRRLATAFAVVWDDGRGDRDLLLSSFQYFVGNAGSMTFDLGAMPYQVSKYVVDTARPIDERLWALRKYAGTDDIGRLYSRVWLFEYDTNALRTGAEKRVAQHGETLPNILKYGGVCREAAIFASEVGKAIGTPSVYIRGVSPSGQSHAWVGYLRGGRSYWWDCETGRLGNERAESGTLLDPQSGETVSEHELDFALAVLAYPEESRMTAQIWCGTAALLAEQGAAGPARQAIHTSLNTGVFDKVQWRTYAALARQGVVSAEDVVSAIGTLVKKLERFPSLSVDAFEQLVGSLGPEAATVRLGLYDQMAGGFGRFDQELLGRIELLKGRYLEELGRPEEAAETYSSAVGRVLGSQSATLDLLDNAGRLLVSAGAVEAAVALHESVLRRLPKPAPNVAGAYSTWSRTALRLAKLRAIAGDRAGHDKTLNQIIRQSAGSREDRERLRTELAALSYGQINRSSAP